MPFGTRVTYSSRKNNSSCSSDWMVNGSVVQDSSMIVFNRSWWNIVDWFYPSLETPRTGVYRIHANDVEYRDQLYDSGRMTVVSAKRISGPNSKASERVEASAQESSWHETEVVYAQPCAAFDLTFNLEPAISVDQIDLIKPSISWTSEEGTTTYDANNPLSAHHVASRNAGTYCITASCGDSQCVILVKVGVPKIHKVTFSNNIGIKRDDGSGSYSNIDWQDNDLDGESDMENANADSGKKYHPVAYRSTDTMSANAVFKIGCTKVTDPTSFIPEFDAESRIKMLRFAPDEHVFSWDWSSPVQFNMQGTAVVAANPFKSVPTVGYESEYNIAWEIGFGDDENDLSNLAWHRSMSQHELYLTYRQKQPSYETVFHLSCTGADGATTDQGVVDGVWSKFVGADVKRKDCEALKYYGKFNTSVQTASGLLREKDGQCAAWARLFSETMRIQGVGSGLAGFRASERTGFLISHWDFIGDGSSGVQEYPYKNLPIGAGIEFVKDSYYDWCSGAEVVYSVGMRAQNNNKPASLFDRHFCVVIMRSDGLIDKYDPSYGRKYRNVMDFESLICGYYHDTVEQNTQTRTFLIQKNPSGNQLIEFQ